MDLAMARNNAPVIPEFLAGGGEMGLINLYNDPYKAIVRGKHPWALGKPAAVVWREIWPTIEPMLRQVMERDEGTYVESQYLIMERNGYPEETYYTFSYTPIPGDNGGTAGMICFNTDDTERIISERQLSTLTRLGKNLTNSQSPAEVIHKTIDTLLENPHDFPVACFYRIAGDTAFLADCTLYRPGPPHSADQAPGLNPPAEVDLSGSNDIAPLVKKALTAKQPQVLEDASAIILPISQSGAREPYEIEASGKKGEGSEFRIRLSLKGGIGQLI
jgi:hypothetical protein